MSQPFDPRLNTRIILRGDHCGFILSHNKHNVNEHNQPRGSGLSPFIQARAINLLEASPYVRFMNLRSPIYAAIALIVSYLK